MSVRNQYADVIVDISHESVDRPFLYKVPKTIQNRIAVGMTVMIPFGKGNTLRKGYVLALREVPYYPEDKIKEIAEICEEAVRAETRALLLADWIRKHYGSTMIAAMNVVLPVKKTMKPFLTKEVSLLLPKDEAEYELSEAIRKKQNGKVKLLKALQDGVSVQYSFLTGKMGISAQTILSMERRGELKIEAFETYRNPIRLPHMELSKKTLTENQKQIAEDFLKAYDEGERRPALLKGVTGSGKTEVYMEIIEGMLERGKQTIVLIPEIALTYQTVLRFYKRFGDIVSVMNSRLSDGEKYDQFKRAKEGKVRIMIGPRSALFTPFDDIGLILIDEEHESSYKSDSMPRYHAREVAIELARMTDARVLMGSATPSLTASYRVAKDKYVGYRLDERVGNATLPAVSIVDLRKELAEGNKSIFSKELTSAMEETLAKGQQLMLFLNRRGIAGFVSCRACGQVLKCPHCDVSLSEHENQMMCHYCGYTQPKVNKCPSCSSPYIYGFKAGTIKVEEQVKRMFPKTRVLRMDADTTKKKDDYDTILSTFAAQEADILIGTQMIVKGHDFPNVTLVGVLAADLSLFASDYSSSERTFQLLTQAVGRAGRGSEPGRAIIQTYQPDHYSIQLASMQDYDSFYTQEVGYRELLEFPPALSMLTIQFVSRDEDMAESYAVEMAKVIREKFGNTHCRVIGPTPPAIAKMNDLYRQMLYVKASEEILPQIKDEMELRLDENQVKRKIAVYFDFA